MPIAPLIYFDFDNLVTGNIPDEMFGPRARYYYWDSRDAILAAVTPTTTGAPGAGSGTAATFNGINSFAYISHSEQLEVQNGTIGLWVNPNTVLGEQTFVSKDESGYDSGGHFRIGMDDGRLSIRFAPGDGGSNMAWETTAVVIAAGQWTHIAVSFGADGVHFYMNGVKIDDANLVQVEGWKTLSPSEYFEAHLLTNDKPIILGADATHVSDTTNPDTVADGWLTNFFDGAIDGFGVWGGADPDDALNASQIASLVNDGPPPLVATPDNPEQVRHDGIVGTADDEFFDGRLGHDTIEGRAGADIIRGGYGNDKLLGGNDDDVLDGGWGSDLLDGGAGNDVLISSSDAGEPFVAQSYNRSNGRNGELDRASGKLYPNQPFVADDIMIGGAGADDFVFRPLINAKKDIILKHQDDDRRIDWSDVAGENGNVHDHWVDAIGTDIIADYDPLEGDQIYIYGHTAQPTIIYRDTDNDGDDESIIRLYSDQGSGGGAHDGDFLGQIIVHGSKVELADLALRTNVTYGIVDTVEDLEDAINPQGILDSNVMGLGSSNPYKNDVDYRDPLQAKGPGYSEFFRYQSVKPAPDDTVMGTAGHDVLIGNPVTNSTSASLASPLSFWRFDSETDGLFGDARSVSNAAFYDNYDDRVFLQTDGVELRAGPNGRMAAVFDGHENFAYIANDSSYQVFNGTVTAWFQTDELGKRQTILAKDEKGSDGGGHFHIAIGERGELQVRLAEGENDGDNHVWKTLGPVVDPDQWHHVAVSFTQDGATIYLDGYALPDLLFQKIDGKGDYGPSKLKIAYSIGNDKPFIIGANSYAAQDTGSAEIIGQNDDLYDHFKGAIADVGFWGGNTAADALTSTQVFDLFTHGPGVLDGPVAKPAAIAEGNDLLQGLAGHDYLDGRAGDDTLEGSWGMDQLFGGYGDDQLSGGGGRDVIEGGHGNDIFDGGDGNDVLISMADDREPRIAQMYNRADDPDYEIDPKTDMLYPSQARMPSADVLTGRSGADTFRFVTLINAKEPIINKHVRDDGTINWQGVAGENNNVHDHWVDGIGKDTITDFDRSEGDFISITGHTTEVYKVEIVDDDGDGRIDDSVLHLRSNQGAGGGAHNMDLLGTIHVRNAIITSSDYSTKANVFFGIIETIYELDEAITPLRGTETLNYSNLTAAVTVNLAIPSMNSGPGVRYFHAGVENVIATGYSDRLIGDEVGNEFTGGNGLDTISGADGDDILKGGGGHDTISGGRGNDKLVGASGSDMLAGNSGNDTLDGGDNHDTLDGGSGNDALYGQKGHDELDGGDGDDLLNGSAGNDDLRGGGGNDKLIGSSGNDTLDGRSGSDTLEGGSGNDIMDGGSGNDMLVGGSDDDRLLGGILDDRLIAGAGDDTLNGGSGSDVLIAFVGNDSLIGGTGDDFLYAGNGLDTLDGGAGSDLLNGSADGVRDTFVFGIGNWGADRIKGFEDGVDIMDMRNSGVTSLGQLSLSQLSDGSALIEFASTNSIRLYGVDIADISSSDFMF